MWKFNYNITLIKKKLLKGLSKKSGHNNFGRITVFHKGGGYDSKYKIIDFKRVIDNWGLILFLEYDIWRSAHLALILYLNGKISYIIASENMIVGDLIFSGKSLFFFWKFTYIFLFLVENINLEKFYEFGLNLKNNFLTNSYIFLEGNAMPLKYIPIGSFIFNIMLNINLNSQICRSAGNFAIILRKTFNKILIKLNSGFFLLISDKGFATIGKVSNYKHNLIVFFKAGVKRKLGHRPIVRGVAMNPVDHPHGGGEGKTSGGRPSVTPWGILTKGKPTVKRKKKFII